LQGVSPCQVRFNQPPVSSVAPMAESRIREILISDLLALDEQDR
jgi:hypothetical protein